MKYIGFGDVNKKLLYIFLGGIGKLIAELILYFYGKDVKMTKHCFILGINAGMGMLLAFIPHVIVKVKSKKTKVKEEEKILLVNDFCPEEKKSKCSKTLKKLFIIFLCCLFDYIQKILTFWYSQYIINNLWIFDIIFLSGFSYFILGIKLYSHQYLSISVMIVFGIILNVIDISDHTVTVIYKLLLSFLIEIFYNLAVVLAKYGMDNLFLNPFEVTLYEGIFGTIVNIISISITTNIERVDPPLLIRLMKYCTYKGKDYIDNFWAYWEEFKYIEILCYIVQMFGRTMFNLFGHIVAKDFTPMHIIFLLMIGELFLSFEAEKFDAKKISSLFIIVIELFMLLIFTEIIELHFWGLDYNTKKSINNRQYNLSQTFDSKSEDSGIEIDGAKIEMTQTGTIRDSTWSKNS